MWQWIGANWWLVYSAGLGVTLLISEIIRQKKITIQMEAMAAKHKDWGQPITAGDVEMLMQCHPVCSGLLRLGAVNLLEAEASEPPMFLCLVFWPLLWGYLGIMSCFKMLRALSKTLHHKIQHSVGMTAAQKAEKLNLQIGLVAPNDHSLSQARLTGENAERGLSQVFE